jgi:hypothetical protein
VYLLPSQIRAVCHAVDMLYIGRKSGDFLRTRFRKHRHAVIDNDANKPVARHFNINSGKHMQCFGYDTVPFLAPMLTTKDMKRGTDHGFPTFSFICLCLTYAAIDSTFNSHLTYELAS